MFRSRSPRIVEGTYTRLHYYLKDAARHPGAPAIRCNYESALNQVGGAVVYSDDNVSVMKVTRDRVEVWIELQASLKLASRIYFLHIVERMAMEQVITADAMDAAIEKDGFVALDIHFVTGMADILPESQRLIKEIAAILSRLKVMNVGVEGHTDNTGAAEGNKILSEARTRSVEAALASVGVERYRLDPAGHGQECPGADNRTDGRRTVAWRSRSDERTRDPVLTGKMRRNVPRTLSQLQSPPWNTPSSLSRLPMPPMLRRCSESYGDSTASMLLTTGISHW